MRGKMRRIIKTTIIKLIQTKNNDNYKNNKSTTSQNLRLPSS